MPEKFEVGLHVGNLLAALVDPVFLDIAERLGHP